MDDETIIRELQKLVKRAQKFLAGHAELDLVGMPTDTVLFFTMSFHGGGPKYTYVALKCENNYWYLTGTRDKFSSTGLELWLSQRDIHEMWIATEWERVL